MTEMRTRVVAEETMARVRDALDLGYFKKFR